MQRTAAAVVALLIASSWAHAELQPVEQLIAAIDTPRDTAVAFSERRMNSLVAEPMQLTGVVEFSSAGTLTKRVTRPIRETISISEQEVVLERDGRSRQFGMRRGSELWEFYVSLRAVLAGNFAGISERYVAELLESGDSWVVRFRPCDDAGPQPALPTMVVTGQAGRIQRVRSEQDADNWQEIVFGDIVFGEASGP